MKPLLGEYKKLLGEFLAFKSISTDSRYHQEILNCVTWLEKLFIANGFKVSLIKGSKCNPIVVACFENDNPETILVYGHYDVQPADLGQGWTSDPFKLVEKSNRLYGRGVVDNKGQVLLSMMAVFFLIKSKKLKYNIKFMIEGNEETANEDMEDLMRKNKNLLKCNYVLVSDGETLNGKPLIEGSLRGGMNIRIKIKTANNDLHSGTYGGAIPNAAAILVDLLDKTVSPDNYIKVTELQGWIAKVDDVAKNTTSKMEVVKPDFVKLLGIKNMTLFPEENFFIKTGLTPTIQITGIKTGYTGEGFSNIIPNEAEARLNIRIVHPMKAEDVKHALIKWLEEKVDKNCDMELVFRGLHNPVKMNLESELHKKAAKVLEKVFGDEPLIKYVGGAVPFITLVKDIMKIDAVSVPLANDDCNMHGPNENFALDLVEKGLQFNQGLFS